MKKTMLGLATILACSLPVRADGPKTTKPAKPAVELPAAHMDTKDWLKFPTTPLATGEIDRLVGEALKKVNIKPAPLTTDEQFIRRVTIDLTGKLPTPAAIKAFIDDKRTEKRAKLIDKLIDTDDFARHWAAYFRDVIVSKGTINQFARIAQRHFDKWLVDQFKANKKWSEITKEMLTASGQIKYDEPDKNGQMFFLASRSGMDAPIELAAESSRIFLGIQIQCAQCHDHPSDVWKRQNFHELAAYFARVRSRPIIEEKMKFTGVQLVSLPFGEHRMPDGNNDPKKGTQIRPKFLDGKGPAGFGLADQKRRESLTQAIVSKDNPWFAGAFVNRIWGELMGQSFYMPVDDMGPQKDAVMPEVLGRVAGAFRGNDYDVKGVFRDILNSQTYQRQIRPGESSEDHLLFAAHSPTRMSANTLWQSLVGTLGELQSGPGKFGPKGGGGPFAGRFGLEGQFKQEFGFDPSSKPQEVEGSVSQALMLMNNPAINAKIRATGTNMLKRVLDTYSEDDEAIRAVYVRTLARRPTDRELTRCREHLGKVNNRAEAYEDILWALINSTEFQTKR